MHNFNKQLFFIKRYFFCLTLNNLFDFYFIFCEKSLSCILSLGYFFESSFTFLDLAGLEHHFKSLGGARKPGT